MELIVKLKQHTPIIHFQWEQKGATLRATELKPKLDRYIKDLKKYYKEDRLKQIGILNNANEAYQLTISQPSIKEKVIPKILDKKTKKSGKYNSVAQQKLKKSLYFGDIKAMLEYGNDVVLRFHSFAKSALKQVYLALPVMLAMENFGSRQNKGFGSFYIRDFIKIPDGFSDLCPTDFLNIEDIYKNHIPNNVYSFECKGDYVEIFRQIFYFYNALRAGTNESGTYSKSLLWKYLCQQPSKNLIWEKRVLKQYLIGDKLPSTLATDYQFIRILLGLSPTYEFKSTFYFDQKKKTKIDKPARMDNDYSDRRTLSIPDKVRFLVEDTEPDKEKKIERVTSPLTFKPIKTNSGYKVYIILKPDLIEGVTTHKYSFRDEKSRWKIVMQPPSTFDLKAFMDFAIKEMVNNRVNVFVNGLKISTIK